ncbi:MAG: esterase/lipase family protein [Pirellulaceae bacterium]
MKISLLILSITLAMVLGNQKSASAQAQETESTPAANWNLPTKTLGGKQFWTDFVNRHGYRIQQHVMTSHFRLLSPTDVRIAWGNFAACRQKLDEIILEKDVPPVTGRVLIVVHGLARTRAAMNPIVRYLAENSDLHVINMSYASTRGSISNHSEALASIIEHLPDADEISFLGHSMGSIVVRYYLGTEDNAHDPRFHRMVMLAPPNHGSRLAMRLQDNVIFKTFWGASGQDLSRHWTELSSSLATPEFEFGIIAGAQPDDAAISNPLIGGANDLVVTVAETRLVGASDFHQQPVLHSFIMNDAEVHQATLSFLDNGWFRTADARQPVTVNLDGE